MKSDLKMYQARVYECKYDIEKINKDMKLLKQEYFHARMQEQNIATRAISDAVEKHQKESEEGPLEAFYRGNPELLHSSNPPPQNDGSGMEV